MIAHIDQNVNPKHKTPAHNNTNNWTTQHKAGWPNDLSEQESPEEDNLSAIGHPHTITPTSHTRYGIIPHHSLPPPILTDTAVQRNLAEVPHDQTPMKPAREYTPHIHGALNLAGIVHGDIKPCLQPREDNRVLGERDVLLNLSRIAVMVTSDPARLAKAIS